MHDLDGHGAFFSFGFATFAVAVVFDQNHSLVDLRDAATPQYFSQTNLGLPVLPIGVFHGLFGVFPRVGPRRVLQLGKYRTEFFSEHVGPASGPLHDFDTGRSARLDAIETQLVVPTNVLRRVGVATNHEGLQGQFVGIGGGGVMMGVGSRQCFQQCQLGSAYDPVQWIESNYRCKDDRELEQTADHPQVPLELGEPGIVLSGSVSHANALSAGEERGRIITTTTTTIIH